MTSTRTDKLRDKTGVGTRKAVNSILAAWNSATDEQITAGQEWYGKAFDLALELSEAGGISVERAAIVIAHLSPRTTWARNVASARAVVTGTELPAGTMAEGVRRARLALAAEDPWDTFTPRARKIRSFAENIIGDPDAVTVDVWACRVAGIDELALTRVGAYDAAAHAYRLAARRVGVSPSVMQATTWVAFRGRAA